MGFYFLIEKGVFLLFREKIKRIRSPSLFAGEKDEITFLEKSNYTGKAAIFSECAGSLNNKYVHCKIAK